VTLYNPHLLARQELIDGFVARRPLLDELVEDLRRGGRQHHLLVGNRGSGKTTLLLRLAAAIEDDPELAEGCIPLRFPEEQYNVSRASDFWMNAIDALLDALERQGDRSTAKRLEAVLADLEPLEEDQRARQALGVLERWTKQAKRMIVLLVDNLDLVLDRLSDTLWAVREALSIENGLVVIGAASKFIEQAIDYQSPFYDFFHVHELGQISEDEARGIVLSLAQRARTPQVADMLERDHGRFQALYVLTGGIPRTVALLHTVLALEHDDRIERDLDGLLDQLTPYYKARFDDLPSQSQLVVDKVALHWHPLTAAECQAATQLDLNTVSAQLSRLVKQGLLAKVALPGEAKLGFQLSERFFNIWYLMRASRRLRRRLSWFVEFLRIFYGEADLRRRAEELVATAPGAPLHPPAKLLAFASAVPDRDLRRRLEFRAITLVMQHGLAAIRDVMDLEGDDGDLMPIVDRVQALHEIRARVKSTTVQRLDGLTPDALAELLAGHPSFTVRLKRAIATNQMTAEMVRRLSNTAKVVSEHSGDRLMRAISTGEAPSLGDVSTSDELRQVLELTEFWPGTLVLVVVMTEMQENPLRDEVIRDLLDFDPAAIKAVMVAMPTLLDYVTWPRIRHLMLLAVHKCAATVPLGPFTNFLAKCVSKQLASEAVELFADTGLAERWAPLHEALVAAAEGTNARLAGLAPEMRVAALELFELLRPREARSTVPAAASKRKAVSRRVRAVPSRLHAPDRKPKPTPSRHRKRPARSTSSRWI
jgi:energy-coupling factor transporter ATP-binding protein EcfA2